MFDIGNATSTALAGAVYGFDAIPHDWVDTLRGKDVIDACLF